MSRRLDPTDEDWNRVEAMILDGWSFGYAMSKCGLGQHEKNYSYMKEHKNYIRLNELYKKMKDDKRRFNAKGDLI